MASKDNALAMYILFFVFAIFILVAATDKPSLGH